MSDFTPQMNAALTDLFMITGGQVGHFCPVKDADLAIYEQLLYYRLIMLESHEAGLTTRWTAALTDEGRHFFLDYNEFDEEDVETLPIRESITLTFNLRDETEAAIYQQLHQFGKNRTLFKKLAQLMELATLLENNDVDALLRVYPELAEQVRARMDAEIDKHDSQQMRQVLSEIEAMKALLKNPHRSQPAQEVPAAKVNGLRPVLPLTPPESAPRQLNVPQFEVPTYEDDEEESDLFIVQADEAAGQRANENFIKSLMSLQDEEEPD